MNKKRKGLKLSEVLLITTVVLTLIATIIAFIIYNGGNLKGYVDVANEYFKGIMTLGITLPAKVQATGNKELLMRTQMFVFVDLFVVVSLIFAFIALVFVFAKKKWRALSGVGGLSITTIMIAYGSGFLVPYMETLGTMRRRYLCTIIGVAALVLVTYVSSVIALADEFKGDLVTAALKDVKKEAKEEKPAPVAQPAAAPVQQGPVEVKVVVEHKGEAAPAPAPVVVEPAPAPVEEVKEVEEVEKRKIERVPFEYKILHSDRDLKKKYAELKEYFESYGLKGRISVDGDSYRLHRVLYVQITVAGKKMKVYYKLRTMDFIDSPIPVKDASHVKKYAEIPCELDVKSDLSVKRAKELIDRVMAEAGIEKVAK